MNGYSGYSLDRRSRNLLSRIFPPKFENYIGHHVTVEFNVNPDRIPDEVESAKVVGYATGDKIEALVVEINGSTTRPDGKIFHITWSLSSPKKPKDSNELLKSGWEKIKPIEIDLKPEFFPFGKS